MEQDVKRRLEVTERFYRAISELYRISGINSTETEILADDYTELLNGLHEGRDLSVVEGYDMFDLAETRLATDALNALQNRVGDQFAFDVYNRIVTGDIEGLEEKVLEYKGSIRS